jgi:hypothetical protein
MRLFLALLAIPAVLAVASAAHAQLILNEDFSGAAAGWTTGTEWQIGATSVGPPPVEGTNPDPAADHSAGSDNRVAGTVLGGNVSTTTHNYYWLQSPTVDVATGQNVVLLRFWRWLNIDQAPFMSARVEVFNGTSWVLLWENTGQFPITDNAWTLFTFDLTPYRNANLRVRFGHAVMVGGGFPFSGWNVDDVQIERTACLDEDGDGHARISCGGDDCNDANPAVYAGAPELCDGVDNNCNGLTDEVLVPSYRDSDGDGFGNPNLILYSCPWPAGYVPIAGDCNDNNAQIHPGAAEMCDGLDNDCDGQVDLGLITTSYLDQDHDGYGNPSVSYYGCAPPTGYILDNTDCDDAHATVHPGAAEICDGLDNDCNGVIDGFCQYGTIESIHDVTNDQGRNVRLTWIRATDDSLGVAAPVVSYSIWRRYAPGLAATARISGSTENEPMPPTTDALPPGTWDFMTMVPAIQEQRYHYVAQTLRDSNAAGIGWSVFLVRAHAGSLYSDAPIDSGYSVDNLVPPAPVAAEVHFMGGGALLSWSPNPAPDFQQFHVYRGSTSSFVPAPGNRVHTTSAVGWTDPTGVAGHVYKVTAVDFNGNESNATTASGPTGVGDGVPTRTAIASVAPNPSRDATGISFDLSVGSEVRLEVLDTAGRLVRRLTAGHREAGHHPVVWDGRDERGGTVASGIYLVRLSTPARVDTRRIVISR